MLKFFVDFIVPSESVLDETNLTFQVLKKRFLAYTVCPHDEKHMRVFIFVFILFVDYS